MSWTRTPLQLRDLRQWAVHGMPRPKRAIVYESDLRSIPWTLLIFTAPGGALFHAAFADYPAFVAGFSGWRLRMWEDEESAAKIASEIRDEGFRLEEFPDILDVLETEAPSLKRLSRKPIFRFSRNTMIPIVVPAASTSSVLDYFDAQLHQFGSRSFYAKRGLAAKPLQEAAILEQILNSSDPMYALILAFGIPPRLQNLPLLLQTRDVLEQVVDAVERGELKRYHFDRVFKARPIFYRHDLKRVLVSHEEAGLDAELEDTCNALRARLVRTLAWPEMYGAVRHFLSEDRPRWDAASRQTRDSKELFSELTQYISNVEGRYPVVLRNPFA